MVTRMLIDAAYPEETRVVVLRGKRLDEFDFETASRKPLKGNIYLAKVTRVEPSLQAAFVDYGGNRHGFLAFNEIHPDYYQIPVEDRQALLAEVQAEVDRAVQEEEQEVEEAESAGEEGASDAPDEAGEDLDEGNGDDEAVDEGEEDPAELAPAGERERPARRGRRRRQAVEAVGGDAFDEVSHARLLRRNYKIQEVIKRRQVLLVQVVKEERGNKGAALTTYLSLAGRYCVLMPNTGRGGGISRKITNAEDRKRLKKVARELEVPEGMGVIVRTAGMERTKAEIRRDYEYLLRTWDEIRELTLNSTAPALVYEEANQIKRAIRDLYNKEIDEVLIEGEDGYKTAKTFMRMLMPSHAKRVQPYKDRIPLFHRFQIDQQLDSMYRPEVQLPSGGYVVINATEALVAIDVNSGRSTKEHNIEETALKTNLEAAEEIARQLRLRDLAGLIVIDFIDMEIHRNNRAVERRLKECLRDDRARIQVGRISPFGLLEMSRQRLRSGVHEINMETCPHCRGSGVVRSVESTALRVLRAIEEEGIRERTDAISVHVPSEVAVYILNQKRLTLMEIESRYNFSVSIVIDESLVPPDHRITRDKPRTRQAAAKPEEAEPTEAAAETASEEPDEAPAADEQPGERRPRRRRRSRRRRKTDTPEVTTAQGADEDATARAEELAAAPEDEAVEDAQPAEGEPAEDAETSEGERDSIAKRRRRGRRGGRRRARQDTERDQTDEAETPSPVEPEAVAPEAETPAQPAPPAAAPETEPAPPPAPEPAGTETIVVPITVVREEDRPPAEPPTPDESREVAASAPDEEPDKPKEADTKPERQSEFADVGLTEPPRPRRRGWWQKRS